jgi:hypothetical protein
MQHRLHTQLPAAAGRTAAAANRMAVVADLTAAVVTEGINL